MAESTIQPDIDPGEEPDTMPTTGSQEQAKAEIREAAQHPTSATPVIWTPSFIMLFTLTLVLGLTAESLFTLGWQNDWFSGSWILLGHVVLIAGVWAALTILARSTWMRIGGIFGCIWAIFTGINLIINLHPFDSSSPIIAHLNASTSIALLGLYICLSTEHVHSPRWDAWFFGLALIGSSIAVGVAYFITPPDSRSLITIEGTIAATALLLCILVWWLRPSCWRTQPAPTLLFGLAPMIMLVLSIPGITNGPNNYFVSQVVLLCLLLGAMRTLQAQRAGAS